MQPLRRLHRRCTANTYMFPPYLPHKMTRLRVFFRPEGPVAWLPARPQLTAYTLSEILTIIDEPVDLLDSTKCILLTERYAQYCFHFLQNLTLIFFLRWKKILLWKHANTNNSESSNMAGYMFKTISSLWKLKKMTFTDFTFLDRFRGWGVSLAIKQLTLTHW